MTNEEFLERVSEILVSLSDKVKENSYTIDFQSKIISKALERIKKLEDIIKEEDKIN